MKAQTLAEEIYDKLQVIINTGHTATDDLQVKEVMNLLISYMSKFDRNEEFWQEVKEAMDEL